MVTGGNLKTLVFAVLLAACTSTESIKKEDWIRCWEACGKKNNLRSVSGSYCRCEDGRKILRDEEKAAPTQSVFDVLGLSPD